jgi:hypothetical protein
MKEFKNKIEEEIKKNKPSLSEKSVKAYVSTLSTLYKGIFGVEDLDLKNFNKEEQILEFLKEKEHNKRKSILSALITVASDKDVIDKYKSLMLKDIENTKGKLMENEKSDKEKENWIEQNEIKKVFELYQNEANKLFKLKDLNMSQLQTLQNFIIICLTSGVFIPPRRSLDWVLMKWKGYNDEDNYYNKKNFVFNQYKTTKFYGKQSVEVPKALQLILNKWVKVIDSDYLLFDSNKNPLNPVKLNQRLNKIFDGKISVNALRHSFITDKYLNNGFSSLKDMSETAQDMGHSVMQAMEYIKK